LEDHWRYVAHTHTYLVCVSVCVSLTKWLVHLSRGHTVAPPHRSIIAGRKLAQPCHFILPWPNAVSGRCTGRHDNGLTETFHWSGAVSSCRPRRYAAPDDINDSSSGTRRRRSIFRPFLASGHILKKIFHLQPIVARPLMEPAARCVTTHLSITIYI